MKKYSSSEIKHSEDDFIERLTKELDKMKMDSGKKECIIELITMELKYPTIEKDAVSRYLAILEEKEGMK